MDICPMDRCPMNRCPLTVGNHKRYKNIKYFAQTNVCSLGHLQLLDLLRFHTTWGTVPPSPSHQYCKNKWVLRNIWTASWLFCSSRVQMTTMLLVNLAWWALWQIVIDLRQPCASFKFCKHREEISKPVSLSTWGLWQARHSSQAKGSMLNILHHFEQTSGDQWSAATTDNTTCFKHEQKKIFQERKKKQKYPNSLKHLALVPQLISILRGSAGRLRPCQNFCQKGWSITRQLCGSTITISTDGNKLSWERKYILLVTRGYIYRH